MGKEKAFLLLGPEREEKQKFIHHLTGEKDSQTEFYTYYPYDTNIAAVISELRNGSLFASSKVVQIKSIEGFSKKEATILKEFCKTLPSHVTLFMISELTYHENIKALESAIPKANKKIYWELFEEKKRSFIRESLKKYNVSISDEAIQTLLELVENTTHGIRQGCDRLLFYLKEGDTIDCEIVEQYLIHEREENAFHLIDQLTLRDFPAAIEALNGLLLSGVIDGVPIIAALQRHFRVLLILKGERHYTGSQNDIFQKMAIRSKRQKELFNRGANNFTLSELEEALASLAEVDLQVRECKKELHRTLLSLMVYRLVAKKA